MVNNTLIVPENFFSLTDDAHRQGRLVSEFKYLLHYVKV